MEDTTKPKMSEEELLKEVQAGEGYEEEEEEEYDEELTEEETKIYEEINLQNLKNFLAQAIGYKAAKEYDQSCLILKLVI